MLTIKIRVYVVGAALLTLAALAQAGPAAPPVADESVRKVVWHVDFGDPRRLSALIQNVNNMVATYQGEMEDYDVRIVFLSGGIRFLTTDALANTPFAEDKELRARRAELTQRLQQLREVMNVKLELCEITREALQVPIGRIIPGVGAVRSGVVRIAELQHNGYAYLKVE